jgi:uncharacterized small protein (DUF1192 family)
MAINPDELEPTKATAKPKDLTVMSIGELQEYIAAMETEITRVREMIAKKQSHRGAIESVFKK